MTHVLMGTIRWHPTRTLLSEIQKSRDCPLFVSFVYVPIDLAMTSVNGNA